MLERLLAVGRRSMIRFEMLHEVGRRPEEELSKGDMLRTMRFGMMKILKTFVVADEEFYEVD